MRSVTRLVVIDIAIYICVVSTILLWDSAVADGGERVEITGFIVICGYDACR